MSERKDSIDLICTGEWRHINTVAPWTKKIPTKCMVAVCKAPLERYDGRRRDHTERPDTRRRRKVRKVL